MPEAEAFKTTRVALGDRIFRFRHVRDIDPLIERMSAEDERDEKIPYYGELWPASIGLARWLFRRPAIEGTRVLDLGCGVGVAGVFAGSLGARVTFADYFDDALELAAFNAHRNGVERFETRWLDWRDPEFREPFDVIVAADVIYETRHHEPVLELVERCLAPGGEAVFSDPGRVHLEAFVDRAGRTPFLVTREEIRVQEAGERVDVIHLVRLAREPDGSL